ncbi:MAG: hypothetical protein V4563_14965 [Pseudomonadota bacterium]
MNTVIMECGDEITRLQNMVEQCHERITALQRELEKMRALHPENSCSDMYPKLKAQNYQLIEQCRRYRDLLEQVHAKYPGHSSDCDCAECEVWRAIDKELTQ